MTENEKVPEPVEQPDFERPIGQSATERPIDLQDEPGREKPDRVPDPEPPTR